MRTRAYGFVGVMSLFTSFTALGAVKPIQIPEVPLTFVMNGGQWDSEVLFRARNSHATYWFTQNGVYYQLTRKSTDGTTDLTNERQPGKWEHLTIRAQWLGGNPYAVVSPESEPTSVTSYFGGSDMSGWCSDIPNYTRIVYRDIYPGIDLAYYGVGDELEYDFVVNPGADPSHVVVSYDGIDQIRINSSGELEVSTDWGTLKERAPFVYQDINSTRRQVQGTYRQHGKTAFGFDLSRDRDHGIATIIDPVLDFSTFLGGATDTDGGRDLINGITVDVSGAVYVTGETYSVDFPTTVGAATDQGSIDAFVSKISASGTFLVFSTYFGGSLDDRGYGIAVDPSGNIYITGATRSPDLPVYEAYDPDPDFNVDLFSDAFVTKLEPSGTVLAYSTFLGGAGGDVGRGIYVNSSGEAYVVGRTASTDFPTTPGSVQNTIGGGFDAFVTKFTSAGNTLSFSTFLGGTSTDDGTGIVVGPTGIVHLCGTTLSSDFPRVWSVGNIHSGEYDAFVSRVSATGSALINSSLLGGALTDIAYDIATDGNETSYLAGQTNSTDFILQEAIDSNSNGPQDAFVSKITYLPVSPFKSTLVFSTYWGGSSTEAGTGISVDQLGDVYVTGYTGSSDFATTPCAHYPSRPSPQSAGDEDAFLTVIHKSGQTFWYSTYLGGTSYDYAYAQFLSASRRVYLAGETASNDFPLQSALDATLTGIDGFITQLKACSCPCENDPGCDSVIDVLDVVYVVNVAFRGNAGTRDQCCPRERTDVDCSGFTDVIDVSSMVDVAFRGVSAAIRFCDACPL